MSLPRSILFLCDYAAPYGGNFIPSLTALDTALKARGCTSVYCFPADAGERAWCRQLIEDGRTVTFFDRRAGFLAVARTLRRIVRSYGVRLVHAHFGLFPQALLLGVCHPTLRIVLHVHSDFSAGRALPLKKRVGRAAVRMLETLMGRRVTRIMVGAHMQKGVKNAVYVQNAIVFGREENAESRQSVRARIGVSDDRTLVLLFGWSPYIKGVDVAVRAIGRLKDDRFVLGVVTGREMTQEKLSEWIAAQPGCEDTAVLFLPPTEDVYAYHHASDVMLSASRSETFSYALAEAIDAMRPCVISDIPGTGWALDYETVTSFPGENDAACADAIRRAAQGFSRETLALAREQIHRDCDINRWVDGILKVYGA